MIRSMTGYGEAERDTPAGRVRLEVKTVNHRFFNASVKTPSGFDKYERDITEVLKRHLSRGHVHAFLSMARPASTSDGGPQLDVALAREYRSALVRLQDELELPGVVDLGLLSRFGDVFRGQAPERNAEEVDAELLVELADEAARAVRTLREAEGERLERDLDGRLVAISSLLDLVEARAPARLLAERDRLREAVRELSAQVEVDEDRLAREIAYLAERWDVSEEVVRFRSHVELFREALSGDGSEPVGKRLGFLAQEMLREANTIGSKANDAEMAHASVGLKEEIERIREQVENVE